MLALYIVKLKSKNSSVTPIVFLVRAAAKAEPCAGAEPCVNVVGAGFLEQPLKSKNSSPRPRRSCRVRIITSIILRVMCEGPPK